MKTMYTVMYTNDTKIYEFQLVFLIDYLHIMQLIIMTSENGLC